jgi:hypothetical protein
VDADPHGDQRKGEKVVTEKIMANASSHLIIPPKVEFPSTQTARIEAAVAVLGLQSCVENDFADVQKAAAKFLIDQFKVT